MMRRTFLAAVATAALAVAWPAAGQAPAKLMPLTAVSGCVVRDGDNWILTNATARTIPAAERTQAARQNVEWAAANNKGTERYRLIGRPLLEEFKIEAHQGHRIVVRGLLVSDSGEKRLNLVSLAMVGASCN